MRDRLYILLMAMTCSVCLHDSRVVIDNILASGKLSLRNVAEQFGLSTTALHRHTHSHILQPALAAARRQAEVNVAVERARSVWEERLHETYGLASAGAERAAEDPKQWPSGARFLSVMVKAVESGLKVDGVIGDGTAGGSTVNIGHIIVMPSPKPLTPIESVIDLPLLDIQSSDEDENETT